MLRPWMGRLPRDEPKATMRAMLPLLGNDESGKRSTLGGCGSNRVILEHELPRLPVVALVVSAANPGIFIRMLEPIAKGREILRVLCQGREGLGFRV